MHGTTFSAWLQRLSTNSRPLLQLAGPRSSTPVLAPASTPVPWPLLRARKAPPRSWRPREGAIPRPNTSGDRAHGRPHPHPHPSPTVHASHRLRRLPFARSQPLANLDDQTHGLALVGPPRATK